MLKYKYNASQHIQDNIYIDPDCIKLQPSEKKGIQTYTKQKIPVIGSCELFVLHSDDQCFHKVKFQVVSVEGSVIISCATSINLNLIQIPKQLDTNIPGCARLIYSSVDAPGKHQYKVQQSILRTKISNKKYQEAHRRPQKSIPEGYSRLCSDRTCQSTRCYKINCNPRRQKISYNQSVKSRKDQEVGSPKVARHTYTSLKNKQIGTLRPKLEYIYIDVFKYVNWNLD